MLVSCLDSCRRYRCTGQTTSKKARPLRSPAGWKLSPSEGHQCLKPRINRHAGQDVLLLNEHLRRQLRQARITLSAERQIIQHLPRELLQSGLAGTESHGWAPRRTPPPAGAGQGPATSSDAERSTANVNNGRHVSTLDASPDHEKDRSGVPSRAGGWSYRLCWTYWTFMVPWTTPWHARKGTAAPRAQCPQSTLTSA